MADPDIVVRLRQGWLAHWDTDVRFVMVYASEWVRLTNLTTESADEIERLRAERDALLEQRDRWIAGAQLHAARANENPPEIRSHRDSADA